MLVQLVRQARQVLSARQVRLEIKAFKVLQDQLDQPERLAQLVQPAIKVFKGRPARQVRLVRKVQLDRQVLQV